MKLQDCPEEFDGQPREAKFAVRSTDLGIWNSSSQSGEEPIDSYPKAIQHWALVVYFPKGEIIHFFEAWEENGKLQAGRAQIAFEDIEIFNKAEYIGTAETSPRQLLKIAKQVYTGEYRALGNSNCHSWLIEFFNRINSDCGSCLSLPIKYHIGITN